LFDILWLFIIFHQQYGLTEISVKEREHDLLATENDIVAHRYSFLAFLFWHYIIVVLGIYHANLSLFTEVEKS